MLKVFLLCLGIWLVIGFITFVRFIKKYKEEIDADTKPYLILICLSMTICGICSPIIIYIVEKSIKDIETVYQEEKINEDG